MSMNLSTSTLLCEYVCMSMPVYMNKKKAYIYTPQKEYKEAYIYTPQKEYKKSIYIYTTEGI